VGVLFEFAATRPMRSRRAPRVVSTNSGAMTNMTSLLDPDTAKLQRAYALQSGTKACGSFKIPWRFVLSEHVYVFIYHLFFLLQLNLASQLARFQ
jgi:hypothetical protein